MTGCFLFLFYEVGLGEQGKRKDKVSFWAKENTFWAQKQLGAWCVSKVQCHVETANHSWVAGEFLYWMSKGLSGHALRYLFLSTWFILYSLGSWPIFPGASHPWTT